MLVLVALNGGREMMKTAEEGVDSGVLLLLLSAFMLILCGPVSAITIRAVSDLSGDLNGDNFVNWLDLSIFANQWLNTSGPADFDSSGRVDIADFSLLASSWLNTGPGIACVAWWKFDETGGTAAVDSSGGGNHGQIRNGVTVGVPGARDTAFSFDGDNDMVFVADNPAIEFQDCNFTIAFWMKSTMPPDSGLFTLPYEPRILCKGSDNQIDSTQPPYDPGTGKRYQFYLNRRYLLLRFCIDDNTDPIYGKSQAETAWEKVVNGNWVHIAGVRDTAADNLKLFLNGTLESIEVDQSGNIDSGTENLIIANGPHTGIIGNPADPPTNTTYGFGFIGGLDDIRIYNGALSEGDIGRIYNPLRAWNPSPVNHAVNTGTSVVLCWSPGDGATSYDVYFGGEFKGNTTETCFDLGVIPDGVYYWRIDALSPAGTTTGPTWMFSTRDGPIDLTIDCTEQALRDALNAVALSPDGGTVTFNCSYTMIEISDKIDFTGSNMTLDGAGQEITLRYTGPDACGPAQGQDYFMSLRGDNNKIAGFKLLFFPGGIRVQEGNNNTIEKITFPIVCDGAIGVNGSGMEAFGTVIRGCYFANAAGDALAINAGGSCTVEHCEFAGCRQPIRIASSDPNKDNGRYTVRNCLISASAYTPNAVTVSAGTVIFENNYVNDCEMAGLELQNQSVDFTEAIVRNNSFRNCGTGIKTGGTVFLRAERNDIQGGSEGVYLNGDTTADFGGGSVGLKIDPDPCNPPSSTGLNIIKGYTTGNSFINATGNALTVKAENNEWNHTTVADVIANDVSSRVDVDPLAAPGTAGTQPPLGPQCPYGPNCE